MRKTLPEILSAEIQSSHYASEGNALIGKVADYVRNEKNDELSKEAMIGLYNFFALDFSYNSSYGFKDKRAYTFLKDKISAFRKEFDALETTRKIKKDCQKLYAEYKKLEENSPYDLKVVKLKRTHRSLSSHLFIERVKHYAKEGVLVGPDMFTPIVGPYVDKPFPKVVITFPNMFTNSAFDKELATVGSYYAHENGYWGMFNPLNIITNLWNGVKWNASPQQREKILAEKAQATTKASTDEYTASTENLMNVLGGKRNNNKNSHSSEDDHSFKGQHKSIFATEPEATKPEATEPEATKPEATKPAKSVV